MPIAAQIAQAGPQAAVTSDETRIIMSFAMAEHGGMFAHWLRDKLMKKFNYYGRNNVYMDCVAVRGLKSEHSRGTPGKQAAGVTYVFPDERKHMTAQGYTPIGAMNSNWDKMYQTAMAQAHTMIMVITPSYLASQWCLQEWAQFQQERKQRPAFKGIGIRFYDNLERGLKSPNGTTLDQRGIKFLTCNRTQGGSGNGLLWHRDSWGICDNDLSRLYEMIGNA